MSALLNLKRTISKTILTLVLTIKNVSWKYLDLLTLSSPCKSIIAILKVFRVELLICLDLILVFWLLKYSF